ncbi:MAG: hypothetical protein JNM76_18025 [Betaproteobacteria bacterium]|nr:hypothetical protein [Betaproteobacteria bacterium]
MKRLMPPSASVALAALMLFFSGCASLPDLSSRRGVDEAKVQAIERAARANGVTIRWVNYPVK